MPHPKHKFEELISQLRQSPSDSVAKKKVREWILRNPDDQECLQSLKNHWDLLEDNLQERDLRQLDRLLENIHLKAGIRTSVQGASAQKLGNNKRISLLQIAAALIFPVLIYSAFNHFRNIGNPESLNLLIVEQADRETRHFFLPDSTEVWLNSDSRISYQKDLKKAGRRLVSLSGQAYFKVFHDASHPFIVKTPQIDIRVLGTCFDVSAYPDDPLISSTLEEGSIALLDKNGKQLEKLVPGEQAVFNSTSSSLQKERVKTEEFTSWKSGKLIFRNAGIAEVAKKLEHRFGCTISISPELLNENPTYTFTIQQEKLEEICRLIELSTKAKATINGQHIQFEK